MADAWYDNQLVIFESIQQRQVDGELCGRTISGGFYRTPPVTCRLPIGHDIVRPLWHDDFIAECGAIHRCLGAPTPQ